MIESGDWALRWMWWKKTGQSPLPFEEFRPGEIAAFFVGIDKVLEQGSSFATGGLSSRIRRWGPPRRLKNPSRWDEAVKTGDPLIDKWEKEIAEGKTPDLSETGRQ